MTSLDIEMLIMGFVRDAKLLGTAHPTQLMPHADLLAEAQDEIARAVQKARRMKVAA